MLLDKLNDADILNDIDIMQSIVMALMLKEKITLQKTFRMEHYMQSKASQWNEASQEWSLLVMVQQYMADLIMQYENKQSMQVKARTFSNILYITPHESWTDMLANHDKVLFPPKTMAMCFSRIKLPRKLMPLQQEILQHGPAAGMAATASRHAENTGAMTRKSFLDGNGH